MNYDYCVAEMQLSYKPERRNKGRLTTSQSAYSIMRPTFPDDKIQYREYFKVLFLNNANEAIGYTTIAEGGLTECMADLRMIFQGALLANAVSMILVHNHPSGNVKPSLQDRQITKQIAEAGKVMRVKVLDHLIITDGSYYSFSDEGLL